MDGLVNAPHVNTLGGYGGYGYGGGGFLEAILLLAIVGGGNGFGGFGGGGNNNMNQISTDFMLTWLNQELEGVECKLDNIDRDVLQSANMLDKDILSTACMTQKAISDSSFANLLGQKDQMFATQQGFCGVGHQLDKVNYDNLLNTNTIVGAINCGNQRIVDWLNCNELREEREEKESLKMKLMTHEIISAQKPQQAVPAYIQPSPYEYYYPIMNQYGNGYGGNYNNGYKNDGCCNKY